MANRVLLIYGKEMRTMARDRRLVIGVAVTSLIVFPVLMGFLGSITRMDGTADETIWVYTTGRDSLLTDVLADIPGVLAYRDPTTIAPHLTVLAEDATIRIAGDATERRTWQVAREIQSRLERARSDEVRARLRPRGVTDRDLRPFEIELVDTSDPDSRGALVLGTLIPYLVIVLLVSNSIRALYIAVGEKEKNTLASLLVSNVPRRSIVIGKSLAIMTFAMYASMLLIVGMVLAASVGFTIGGDALGAVNFRLSAVQIVQIVLNVGSIALLVAAIIMILGTVARTQREAGVYTSPLLFVSIFLAVFSFADVDFGWFLYGVPILGNSLAMRETFLGTLQAYQLVLPLLTNVTLFVILIWGSVRLYQRETVLFRR